MYTNIYQKPITGNGPNIIRTRRSWSPPSSSAWSLPSESGWKNVLFLLIEWLSRFAVNILPFLSTIQYGDGSNSKPNLFIRRCLTSTVSPTVMGLRHAWRLVSTYVFIFNFVTSDERTQTIFISGYCSRFITDTWSGVFFTDTWRGVFFSVNTSSG